MIERMRTAVLVLLVAVAPPLAAGPRAGEKPPAAGTRDQKALQAEIEKLVKHAILKSADKAEPRISELLSNREIEMLKLLATGMNNKQIADKLCLSLRTIKTHMSNIFTKMNVASRSEALVEALRSGLINLEDINRINNTQDQAETS